MIPMGLTAYRVGHDIHVPVNRISELAHGRLTVSADTALRLARYFGTSPQFWLGLQNSFDLETATLAAGTKISETIHPHAA